MHVVTRYAVPVEDADDFLATARPAMEALTASVGCTSARVGRAADDATAWTLLTTWVSVGAYRRALSSYEVKLRAVPLLSRALDEASAYEDVLCWTREGSGIVETAPDRAGDADTARRGRDADR